MDIENLRADLVREGYDAEASQALAAAVNDAAVRNSMTPQQVLTIAQRIVADDLTGTKTLAAAVQEVRDVATGVDTAGTGQLSNMSNEDLLNMLRR
jgi:lysozyme family protein